MGTPRKQPLPSSPLARQYRWNAEIARCQKGSKTKALRGCGESDARAEVGDRQIDERLDFGRLALACLEDAVKVMGDGDPRKWPFPDWQDDVHPSEWARREEAFRAYKEAVYWAFYELDPLGERVFSLNWCVGAINQFLGLELSPDRVREDAIRMGLMPSRLRERRSKAFKIKPLGARRAK